MFINKVPENNVPALDRAKVSRIASMARAMTAVREVRNPDLGRSEPAALSKHRGTVATLSFLVAKNVLFWGSVSLSLYWLYAVTTFL